MPGRTDSRVRALLVLVVLVLVAGSLGVRLAYWQVVRRDELAALAREQTSLRTAIPTARGSIYDRSGTVVLATSVERDVLAATPRILTPARRAAVADRLVELLGLTGEAGATLRSRMTSDREYVVLTRSITAEMAARIRELSSGTTAQLAGLVLEPEQERLYPQPGGGPGTTLAAHLLGFVNRDGTGQYGVEQRYQSDLAGRPRVVAAEKDATGRAIPDSSTVLEEGTRGADVTLTIDASLQVALEQELLSTWISDRAKRVSALVMDPYTGEVYGYGSYPSYDANAFQQIAGEAPERFVDPIVSTVYEPGSVFKMLTVVAALGAGKVTPMTRINDTGRLLLDGGRAHVSDADRRAMGVMTFQDAIAYSRNVVAAKVALKLGKTTAASAQSLYDTWRRLGFGTPTGIDVAGEVGGLVRDPRVRPWREVDVANGAFGQGIAVTPIQLAQAYAAMINGGTLVRPRVVKAVGTRETAPASEGQVLPASLSPTLQGMLRHVLDTVDFYRSRTQIPGYDVGGKTGTAQIWDPALNGGKGDWKVNKFNYSFIGYVGRQAGHPDLVVAVRIEEGTPTVARQGLIEMPVMSFELFRRIAHDAITAPDLVPDRPPVEPLTAHP